MQTKKQVPMIYVQSGKQIIKMQPAKIREYQSQSKFWILVLFLLFLLTMGSAVAAILQYGFGYHIF